MKIEIVDENISNEDLSTMFIQRVWDGIEQPAPCLKCGAPGRILGIYRPGHPSTLLAPAGKTRVVTYWSCPTCYLDIDSVERVANEKINAWLKQN